MVSSEVPRTEEKRRRKVTETDKLIKRKDCSLSRFSKIVTKIQFYGDDSALHSQSDLNTATSTRGQAEQNERQQVIVVDHDDTPRLVSQHICNNVRSPFDTPERRKRASEHADSSRSEQKYSQEARLTASDTFRTDRSEDDTSNKTNESRHSDIDVTFETQHNTPNEESKPEDIQRRIKIRCDKVQSKILDLGPSASQSSGGDASAASRILVVSFLQVCLFWATDLECSRSFRLVSCSLSSDTRVGSLLRTTGSVVKGRP